MYADEHDPSAAFMALGPSRAQRLQRSPHCCFVSAKQTGGLVEKLGWPRRKGISTFRLSSLIHWISIGFNRFFCPCLFSLSANFALNRKVNPILSSYAQLRSFAGPVNHKKLEGSVHFWKMRSTKCAQDCCESSVSHTNHKNVAGSDHFLKMRSTKCARE